VSNKSTSDTEKEAPQDFAAFLLGLARGHTHEELSRALRDLTAAVVETGKPGALKLEVTIKRHANSNALDVTDKVTTKIPGFDRAVSIFFADGDNNLVRNDPKQPSLYDNEGNQPR
jgi:hypothetical protein